MKFLLLLMTSLASLSAASPPTYRLWPQGAPEPAGFKAKPETDERKADGLRRVGEVSDPTLTVYAPPRPNGTAVLVCPGGGYHLLAYEHEGTQVCEWLNTLGVTAVLLKYRVPRRSPTEPGHWPLQDAQRAMGLIRHHAGEWGVRADRVGVLGFSAGGHLCVSLALRPNERSYPTDPALDVDDVTPNFVIPIYPAYLVDKEATFQLLPEFKVTAKAPPICLVHAGDDKGATSASGSALLYLEYKKLNLPSELHIYSKGGHGFGMKVNGVPSDAWTQRVGEWLQAMGWADGPFAPKKS